MHSGVRPQMNIIISAQNPPETYSLTLNEYWKENSMPSHAEHGQTRRGEIVSDDEKIAKHHSRSQTVYHIVSHLRVNAIADYGTGKLAKLSTRKIELILRKECHSSSHRRDVYRKQRSELHSFIARQLVLGTPSNEPGRVSRTCFEHHRIIFSSRLLTLISVMYDDQPRPLAVGMLLAQTIGHCTQLDDFENLPPYSIIGSTRSNYAKRKQRARGTSMFGFSDGQATDLLQ
ncbi:speckle-type POZ [Fusarium circinatum]|uniref:Speckle-type POZ n=1 Tax=Fusarium circinatum TaxID=48490 RepID=A0A8H5WIY6_FUSCI|nr:speckle-type POZ [Fusarium circinatum]